MATISFATKKPKPATEAQVVPAPDVEKLKSAAPTETVEQPKKSTVSFKSTAPKPEPVQEQPKQTQAVAQYNPTAQLQGEFNSQDIAIPYLNLAQKTSNAVDENPELLGQWIFDKIHALGTSVRVVLVRMTKRYEEDLPYGSDEIPRRYNFAEDARKEGVHVRDVADIDLLIETELKGETPKEFGAFRLEKKDYIPARMTVRSSSYGTTVKIFVKDMGGWLGNDLSSGFYQLHSEKRKGPKGSWYVPKPAADGKVSEGLRKLIAEQFNN